jgi:alkyldihydroxyacetonephosphate synthase
MKLETIQTELRALLGDKVKTDVSELTARSHDFWLLDMQRRLHGSSAPLPICVVAAECGDDVAIVLRFASAHNIPVVPYGAGSGVCGGAQGNAEAITLDLRSMNRILDINEKALTVTVEPGMLGSEFERRLNLRGYSMGHFPQSMQLSSVGGWVATRASGQYSNKYGNIEDMLVCLEGYLADGTHFSTRNAPRSATGPSVNELMLGSEGALAVITSITYKIHPLPEAQMMTAFQFDRFDDALDAIRLMMRSGWAPALTRLYDAAETKRHFQDSAKKGSCVLLFLSEGPRRLVQAEFEECSALAKVLGGVSLGEGPVRHWLERRFVIPDLNDLALNKGVVFDTIEVAGNWDVIGKVYNDAIAALNKVPGIVNASAHSSHSYAQGTCLYFTFAVKKPRWKRLQVARLLGRKSAFASPSDLPAVEKLYEACWSAVMEAVVANGGTVSHHHGIGKVRMPWVEQELGSSKRILDGVKDALDPAGILNPGTLFVRRNRAR